MKSYNVAQDLKTIRKIFGLTQTSFATRVGLSRSNIIRYESEETFPHKSALEKLYSFAFDNELNINKAKEMLFHDEQKDKILLFHGAKEEIKGEIDHNHLIGSKDFGAGFYLSDTYDSATSWIAERENGSCYCFYFTPLANYKIIKFDVSIEWMYAILYFRGAFEKYELSEEISKLINKINESDVIIAPIANNNMYEVLNSFAYSTITDVQCLHALSANNLGLQFVFKSERACKDLEFIDRLYICENEKRQYINKKKELATQGRSKVLLSIEEYRREGKYFDEIFKKNG